MQNSHSAFVTGPLSQYEHLALQADDTRPHPEAAALEHAGAACINEVLDVLADTALEDYQTTIIEGLIGGFHSAIERLKREADKARDEVRQLQRDFDGSEVLDDELQQATRKFTAADAAVMAMEFVRDSACATYTVQTGEVWTPWRGNVRASRATAAMVDAKDMIRANRERSKPDFAPGPVVAFRGAPNATSQIDANRIFDALNWAHQQHPNMALTTSGAPGAERLALQWASQKKVRVILARPDFTRHEGAAPFKANDTMLNLDPTVVLTLANTLDLERRGDQKPSGIVLNLGQKAEQAGIRHFAIQLR